MRHKHIAWQEVVTEVVTDEDYDIPVPGGDSHEWGENDEPCPVLQPREELEDYDDPVQSY